MNCDVVAQIKSWFWIQISCNNPVHTGDKVTYNNLFDSQQQNKNTSKYITDMLHHNDLRFYLEDAK